MPLSEESDPFARRHFAGSSGGETVSPWNGSGWNCAGGNCAAGLVPTACPRSAPPPPRAAPPPGTTTPAEKQSQSSSAHTAPPALAFSFAHLLALLLPRPCPATAPTMTATACPICPAWAVSACPMSSRPPARSPAWAAPSSRTPPT